MFNKMKKDTIAAKFGYRVRHAIENATGREVLHLYDGDEPVLRAYPMTCKDYEEEMECNEAFVFFERFTTTRGNRYIYAHDAEADVDYLVKIFDAKEAQQ